VSPRLSPLLAAGRSVPCLWLYAPGRDGRDGAEAQAFDGLADLAAALAARIAGRRVTLQPATVTHSEADGAAPGAIVRVVQQDGSLAYLCAVALAGHTVQLLRSALERKEAA
jgi:hypothetical protein